MATTSRNEYFDILRGIAIIAVVAIHSIGTGLSQSPQSFDFNLTLLFRNAINFAVPLFLAISGYFLASKKVENFSQYLVFIQRQIPKVYVPLMLWSLIWFLLTYLRGEGWQLFKLFTFQANEIYYFIALIIQCYLLLPWLKKLATNAGLLFSVVLSVTMTYVIFALRYYAYIDLPLIAYAGNVLTWMMFFVLGLYFGKNKTLAISQGKLLTLVVLSFVLSCIESYWLIAKFAQPGEAVTAVKASSFLYSFFVILLLFKHQTMFSSKLLKRFGEASFGIYLVHMLVLILVGAVIKRVAPWLLNETLLYQFILIFSVSFLSLFGIKVTIKILPKRMSDRLGLS